MEAPKSTRKRVGVSRSKRQSCAVVHSGRLDRNAGRDRWNFGNLSLDPPHAIPSFNIYEKKPPQKCQKVRICETLQQLKRLEGKCRLACIV